MSNWLKAITVSVFTILAPIHAVMATALIMIILDLVLGVWAAHKRGEPITSAGLRRTITKVAVYEIGVIAAFLGEHYMLGDAIPLVKLAGAAIALVEIKSIVESLNDINGSPVFNSLIQALGSKNDDPPPPPSVA